MASWRDVSLTIPAVPALDAAAEAAETAADAALPVARTTAAILRAIATFQDGQDLVADIVRESAEALDQTLSDFLSPSVGHALFIPPIPPFRRDSAGPLVPVRKLEDIVYNTDLIRGPFDDLVADGGNYGLYRKFVESIFDPGDYARPTYDSDAYIGGVILVFGNPTFATTIQGLLQLDNLTGGALNIRADNYQLPVPQNVKARPIATPAKATLSSLNVVITSQVPGEEKLTFSDEVLPFAERPAPPQDFAVRVSWDRPPVVRLDVGFGRYVYQLKKWHVYVKKGGRILPGEDLASFEQYAFDIKSAGYSVRPGGLLSGTADVAANFSGVVLTDLESTNTYYVSVAYTVEIQDLDNDTADTLTPTVAALSNQVRVNLSEQAPYNQIMDGLPPDWLALSSPLAFFPIIQDSVRQARAALDVVLSNYADYSNEVSAIADRIEDVVESINELAQDVAATTERSANIIDEIELGAYASAFSGRGGLPFLIKTVGDLLLASETENKPPFTRGDEAVSALVLVTGADSPTGVETFISLCERLFGAITEENVRAQGISLIDRVEGDGYAFDVGEDGQPTEPGDGFEPPVVPPAQDLGVVDEDPC